MESDHDPVHIFSIYEPIARSTKFLYLPVTEKNEDLTPEQIFAAEKRVQKSVPSTTAVVRYLGIGMSAISMNAPDQDDFHWGPREE